MLGDPLVSVALPVKNGLPHLREAIEGLRRQSYRQIELRVQDGGSTDGSLEYLRGLELPFPMHVISEHDGSLTAGYNRAFRHCIGDLVVAAACDEVLDDNAIELYVTWHREHPDAVFIYGGSRLVVSDEIKQVFQPKDFSLIDYIRHQMCPTTAGVFNRRQLGAELRLDESLRTVPDFELLTRLALRFGEGRIVCKQAITMTARGDAASMSFRPDAYTQFARDKKTVIDRLLHGVLRDGFLDYFRRDALFSMHAQFAEQAYHLAGDGPEFSTHLMAAAAEQPGRPQLRRIVEQSRRFRWDAQTGAPVPRRNVAPLPPPTGHTSVLAQIDLRRIRSEPHWKAAGAAVRGTRAGVHLRTPNVAWHYSAILPLDSGSPADPAMWRWLRITYSSVTGVPLLALFDPGANALQAETALKPGLGMQDLFFELQDPAFSHLLLRNGASRMASSVTISAIDVLTMPVVPELAA